MYDARQPFDVRAALPALRGGGFRGFLREGLEWTLGLPEVRHRFASAAARPGNPFANAVQAFELEHEVTGPELPSDGPLVVVANHPFGGADALTLGALCITQRPEALILANRLAADLPGVGERMLPLSIMGSDAAARENTAALRRAIALLRGGGCLAVFPSGEVARWRGAGVEEGPWSAQIAALIRKTNATVVPVGFPGGNPPAFHLLGGIHPLVRTALLPRMLLGHAGRTVELRIGEAILPGTHRESGDAEFAALLRARSLALARM